MNTELNHTEIVNRIAEIEQEYDRLKKSTLKPAILIEDGDEYQDRLEYNEWRSELYDEHKQLNIQLGYPLRELYPEHNRKRIDILCIHCDEEKKPAFHGADYCHDCGQNYDRMENTLIAIEQLCSHCNKKFSSLIEEHLCPACESEMQQELAALTAQDMPCLPQIEPVICIICGSDVAVDGLYCTGCLEHFIEHEKPLLPFRVFHPVGGALNHECKRSQFEYELIIEVHAKSLQDTFTKCQNDFSTGYASLGKRSTSVGDIIIDDKNNIHYMITGIGFDEIPNTVTQYIDWGNH